MADPNISIGSYEGYRGQVDSIESIANELVAETAKQKGLIAEALKADLTSFTEGGVVAPCYAPVAEVTMPYVEKVLANASTAGQSSLNAVKTLRNAAAGVAHIDETSAGAVKTVGNDVQL